MKTITDRSASEAIAQFGLERHLEEWVRPSPLYKRLRQLTRERDQHVLQRTAAKNQLHAERSEAQPHPSSVKRLLKVIAFLDQLIEEIQAELKELIKKEVSLGQTVKRLCTLPGIGVLTAATILGETNGFDLIRNKKQLTSYAGLDVREKQSGTSVKGKPRISKKGNRHLRKAMHMPALTALKHDQRFKDLYHRLLAKHGVKMKAVVPIQRKLLEMSYLLFKNKVDYDKDYLADKVQPIAEGIKN